MADPLPNVRHVLRVCVVGSLNVDLVVKVPRLPAVGETVTGGVFATFPGGKGANQAVAAARLGARAFMVGRVGEDDFGRRARAALEREGVDVAFVRSDPEAATGVALIGVDPQGRNLILVAPGANARVSPDDVERAGEVIRSASLLLLQLEIPMETVRRAAEIAHEAGVRVVLDPAPAAPLPEALYPLVDVINPNEIEARALTGLPVGSVEEAVRAAEVLQGRGARAAVVKLGEHGAVYASAEARGHVPAFDVPAQDTTAAGDAFAAALGVGLAEGKPLVDAVRFANAAAALKVTRMGAQSMPTRSEVEALLAR